MKKRFNQKWIKDRLIKPEPLDLEETDRTKRHTNHVDLGGRSGGQSQVKNHMLYPSVRHDDAAKASEPQMVFGQNKAGKSGKLHKQSLYYVLLMHKPGFIFWYFCTPNYFYFID